MARRWKEYAPSFQCASITDGASCVVQLLFGGWGVNDLPKQSSEIELFLAALDGREPIPAWLVSTIRLLAENGDPTFEHIRIRMCPRIDHTFVPSPVLSQLRFHTYNIIKPTTYLQTSFPLEMHQWCLTLSTGTYGDCHLWWVALVLLLTNARFRQGCTKALLGNLALNSMLAAHDHEVPLPKGFSSQYFHRTAPRMTGLWCVRPYTHLWDTEPYFRH